MSRTNTNRCKRTREAEHREQQPARTLTRMTYRVFVLVACQIRSIQHTSGVYHDLPLPLD